MALRQIALPLHEAEPRAQGLATLPAILWAKDGTPIESFPRLSMNRAAFIEELCKHATPAEMVGRLLAHASSLLAWPSKDIIIMSGLSHCMSRSFSNICQLLGCAHKAVCMHGCIHAHDMCLAQVDLYSTVSSPDNTTPQERHIVGMAGIAHAAMAQKPVAAAKALKFLMAYQADPGCAEPHE